MGDTAAVSVPLVVLVSRSGWAVSSDVSEPLRVERSRSD
jgi:hypothetical protein